MDTCGFSTGVSGTMPWINRGQNFLLTHWDVKGKEPLTYQTKKIKSATLTIKKKKNLYEKSNMVPWSTFQKKKIKINKK